MVIQDETGKQVLVTTKPVRFGRSPENEVVLTEEYVSRFHCHVILKNDKFFLQDLGSTSGTFVSLTHPALLR
jgi:pSer/pThr/pTyr-binding forkhead associated (FHA) protein